MDTQQTIVVALGGNALGKTPQQQLALIQNTAKSLVDMIEEGYRVVITHGNGPQVGALKVSTDYASQHGVGPEIPFAECGAMSQGYIGYHLQQAMTNELARRDIHKPVVSVVTQTLVDAADPAFQHPTKPVGAFYSEAEAKKRMEHSGDVYVEDSGRGWRWVVASPLPTYIVETDTIKSLVESGCVVVAAGGGGIPVVKTEAGYKGVAAVIDKDNTAALLAHDIKADRLVILTAVEKVAINFNKPNQQDLDVINVEQAKQYSDEGQFAPGSMLPKISACVNFVQQTPTGEALITSLECAKQGLLGKTGTRIVA